MQYEKKSFTVPLTGPQYAEGWEACFGKKAETDIPKPKPTTAQYEAVCEAALSLIQTQTGEETMAQWCTLGSALESAGYDIL